MEVEKKKFEIEKKDNEIVYSHAIKAGKRIYYLDVKKSRNEDLFLAITESKKKIIGYNDNAQVTYEKHKIFLYKEDFDKFLEGMQDVIGFIKKEQGEFPQRSDYSATNENDSASESDTNVETEENKSKSFFDRFKL
jgi:hypothetical protein